MGRTARLNMLTSISALLIVGCAPSGKGVIGQHPPLLTDYIAAKRKFAVELQKAMGGDASRFQLVAISGPQWAIGTIIDPANPLVPKSLKCVVKSDLLPTAILWAELPGLTKSQTIDFSAGLPTSAATLINKEAQAQGKISVSKTGSFALKEISAVTIAQDDLLDKLSEECRNNLSINGGMVVTGIVSAKESFKSGRAIVVDPSLKIAETEILKLKLDQKGDFELEDKAPTPKMFMVTLFRQETLGSGDIQTAPSAVQVQQIERQDLTPIQ